MTTISCKTLVLQLDDRGRVMSLRHRDSGYEFLSAQAHPVGLWQLGLIHPVSYDDPLPPTEIPDVPQARHESWTSRNEYRADLALDSDEAPAPDIRADADGATLSWRVPVPGGEAAVTLRIDGGEARARFEFRFNVTLPDVWALKRATFPRVRGFGDRQAPAQDQLLFPETWGVLRSNPLEDMTNYVGQYPSHVNWCQMTAWLHDDNGLYLGVLDPDTHHTGIDAQYVEGANPAPWNGERWQLPADDVPEQRAYTPLAERMDAEPAMQLRVNHWPQMVSTWACPYPVVLQGFSGNWYDAAMLHRAWATQQRWCRRGKLSERTDTSSALASMDLWFIRYGFPAGSFTPQPAWEFQQVMHRLQEYFGMPFGVHWYNWHNFSWHSGFPAHAPVVEDFAEVVKDLQARGIVVMPYCQGRILYRDRPTLETDRDHASVETNGQPYLERYTPGDDWPLALCPGDAWSRQQWVEAARMLWRHYGVDGVYFDQITAMIPSLCYHAGHGHPLGGGTFYWKGYDQALEAMAPMVDENSRRFLSSELLADAYMDRIDLYLSFVPPLEDFVPLFAAIYGDYTTVMGRNTPTPVLEDTQLMALCQGEQFLFGGIVGWTNEMILNYPPAAEYLRDLARLRAHVRDVLHIGTLQRPLAMAQDTQIDVTLPGMLCAKPHPLHVVRDAVRHTIWRASDGRLLVLLLNESREDATVRFTPPSDWPRGTWQQWTLGSEEATRVEMSEAMTITVPALGAMALTTPR